MNSSEHKLRSLIKQIIKEDYDGFDSGGMIGPYGVHFANSDQLYNAFVKPFVDVVDVAGGKTKELSQKTNSLLKIAFESIATTLLPFLQDSYKEIFANEKEALDSIKSEYNDVYNATWDAFKDNDIVTMAFMYNPGSVLTSTIAKKLPGVTGKLLSVLSGGSLDGFLDKVKEKFGRTGKQQQSRSAGGNSDSWYDENKRSSGPMLTEDQEKHSVQDVITNKKVVEKALSSTIAQRMQKDAQTAVRKTLTTVYKQAQAIASANNLQDLQNKLGKKVPGGEKLNQIPEQEKQSAETELLATVKKSMKQFYVQSLEAQLKQATDNGITNDNKFVKDYNNIISKIKAL